MIKKKMYKIKSVIQSVPFCDKCNTELRNTNLTVSTYPLQFIYQCPQCKQEYKFNQFELADSYQFEYIGDYVGDEDIDE